MLGTITPWSHVPNEFLPFDDLMTFKERAINVAVGIYQYFQKKYDYIQKQQDYAEKYFASLPGTLLIKPGSKRSKC